MGDVSARYDLWINGSHMSAVPSKAARSILLVMFPFPLDDSPLGKGKRWLAKHIHRQMLVPRYGAGFFGPQELGGTRYRWTAGRGHVTIQTPWPGAPLPVRLVVGSFRPSGWEPVQLTVLAQPEVTGPPTPSVSALPPLDGAAQDHACEIVRTAVQTTPGNYVTLDATVPGDATRTGAVTLVVQSPTYRPFEVGGTSGEADDYREVGVAVARVMVRHPRHYAYEALFERLVPELSRRLHGLPDARAMHYLDTYDAICPISEFSNYWLERYWGKRGTILYPPVDVTQFAPRVERKPIILGVGRFFHESHNKKHDEMIKTFRQLVREGLHGWELHLVGGLEDVARHKKYFEDCRRRAQGLPVVFHVNAPAAELKALYERASIYWHATGFGERVERNPIVFEHFGITVVEAMAAGCVPVVIGTAGPKELVEDGESGFLWTTRKEWKRRTLDVATDPALAARLRAAALARSARFGEAVFRQHLLSIVRDLGLPDAVGRTVSAGPSAPAAPAAVMG
jgi:glycosyltransferase involved in cell wall biosynthesis